MPCKLCSPCKLSVQSECKANDKNCAQAGGKNNKQQGGGPVFLHLKYPANSKFSVGMQNLWLRYSPVLNNIVLDQKSQEYFYFHWKSVLIIFIYFSPQNPEARE